MSNAELEQPKEGPQLISAPVRNLILHPTLLHSVIAPKVPVEFDAEQRPHLTADGVVYGGNVQTVVGACLPPNSKIPRRPPARWASEALVVQQTDEVAAYVFIDDSFNTKDRRIPIHVDSPDVRLVTWAKVRGYRRWVMSQICLKVDLIGYTRRQPIVRAFEHDVSSPLRPFGSQIMRPTIEDGTKLKECIGNQIDPMAGVSGIAKVAACVFRSVAAIPVDPPPPITAGLSPVYLELETLFGASQLGYKFYWGDYNGKILDKRIGGVVAGNENYLMVWAKQNLAGVPWTKLLNGPVRFNGG